MSYHLGDTICAIASAWGGAARGIVRVSGPRAVSIVDTCCSRDHASSLRSIAGATAIAAEVQIARGDGPSTIRLPCKLFIWPTNRSYTREPVVELHTFGSQPILAAIVAALCAAGARIAEPGEFTLRAFLAGRIDLTQAEAVLGVIDAVTHDELQSALAQLSGGLAGPLVRLREDLLQLLAELEAGLDFAEEDIEFITSDKLLERITSSISLLDEVDEQMASRRTSIGLPQIVLVGSPNAGKSSLFNALVERYGRHHTREQQEPAALVSPVHGTTRDYLTASLVLDGLQFELIDTAGVEECYGDPEHSFLQEQNSTEAVAIDAQAYIMAQKQRAEADVRLHCIDAIGPPGNAIVALTEQMPAVTRSGDLLVITKSDLSADLTHLQRHLASVGRLVVTSSRTGYGLAELCGALRDILRLREGGARTKGVCATAERCQESIRLARHALSSANAIVAADGGNELVAEELRTALSELGKVVGAVYTDDLLDRIFSTFCIGK